MTGWPQMGSLLPGVLTPLYSGLQAPAGPDFGDTAAQHAATCPVGLTWQEGGAPGSPGPAVLSGQDSWATLEP